MGACNSGGKGALSRGARSANDAFDAYAKVTEDQREALAYYQEDGYSINADLRDGYPLTDLQKEYIDVLDTAINSGEIKQDMTVYRGVGANAFGITNQNEYYPMTSEQLVREFQARIGKTYQDDGYFSTSTEFSIAEDFANNHGYNGAVVIEAKVRKGTKAMYLDRSGYGGSEKEMLFGRSKQQTIKGVREENGNVIVSVVLN